MKVSACSDCVSLEADRSFVHKGLVVEVVPLGVFEAEVDPNALHSAWRCATCGRLWKRGLQAYVDRSPTV